MDYKTDIKEFRRALNQTQLKRVTFSKYSKIYSFSTENLAEMFNKIDVSNKKVLVVQSSGDHAINALLNGASRIDCFDINIVTKYYFNLKLAVLKTFPNVFDFYNFLYCSSRCFLLEAYEMIRENMSFEDRVFFDSVYKFDLFFKNSKFLNDVFYDSVFYKNEAYRNCCSVPSMGRVNPYINEKTYEKAREKADSYNGDFYNVDVKRLKKCIGDKKYDVILLSNLCQYIDTIFNGLHNIPKYASLVDELMNNLYDGGLILFGYVYDYPSTEIILEQYERFEVPKVRDKYFSNYESSVIDGFYKNTNDLILIKRK